MMFLVVLGLLACAGPAEPQAAPKERPARPQPAPTEPYVVENWFGTWTGLRPEYPLLNPDGEVIVVRGREAKVGASTFTFTIGAMGQAGLVQSHDDGRVAEFSGTWKGRTRPGTQTLDAIVCDLTANSTGAYRQFALMIDDAQQAVLCHGTSAEPVFAVTFVQP
jgi:hypothetical protein